MGVINHFSLLEMVLQILYLELIYHKRHLVTNDLN